MKYTACLLYTLETQWQLNREHAIRVICMSHATRCGNSPWALCTKSTNDTGLQARTSTIDGQRHRDSRIWVGRALLYIVTVNVYTTQSQSSWNNANHVTYNSYGLSCKSATFQTLLNAVLYSCHISDNNATTVRKTFWNELVFEFILKTVRPLYTLNGIRI